jgi:hypothetical protein
MDATTFRSILRRLELSQQALGRLLAVSKTTPQRWAAGGCDGVTELMMWMLADGTITPTKIEATKARVRAKSSTGPSPSTSPTRRTPTMLGSAPTPISEVRALSDTDVAELERLMGTVSGLLSPQPTAPPALQTLLLSLDQQSPASDQPPPNPSSPKWVRWKDKEGREFYTPDTDPRYVATLAVNVQKREDTDAEKRNPPPAPIEATREFGGLGAAPTLEQTVASQALEDGMDVADSWAMPPRR